MARRNFRFVAPQRLQVFVLAFGSAYRLESTVARNARSFDNLLGHCDSRGNFVAIAKTLLTALDRLSRAVFFFELGRAKRTSQPSSRAYEAAYDIRIVETALYAAHARANKRPQLDLLLLAGSELHLA